MSHQEAFSVVDAAKVLGVSRWTVYRLIHDGTLSAFHVRHRTRIYLGELRRYKAAHAIAADEV